MLFNAGHGISIQEKKVLFNNEHTVTDKELMIVRIIRWIPKIIRYQIEQATHLRKV